MHALQYTWLHLRRNPLNAVITLTVSMTILLVIMSVQQMMISRYNTLADISAATRVRCVVTDGRGQRTDELLVDKRF